MTPFRSARCATLPALLLAFAAASGQSADLPMRELHATAGHDAQKATAGEAYRDSTEVVAALQMRLREADPKRNGQVWLEFSADTGTGPHANALTIRIPLASTDAPQADAGTCANGTRGTRMFTFTAAADRSRSVPFQPASRTSSLELSLNQYLCRALAVRYRCDRTPETLPQNWLQWRLARRARLLLTSDAASTLELSPVAIIATDRPFTAAQCAKP